VASEKMRVIPGTEKEIRKKRAVLRPANKSETIMMRGTNASAPDLVCGSCGAVLAVGISSHNLRMAIACNRCNAVNETIARPQRQRP
jgi:phage FluMu protein Com